MSVKGKRKKRHISMGKAMKKPPADNPPPRDRPSRYERHWYPPSSTTSSRWSDEPDPLSPSSNRPLYAGAGAGDGKERYTSARQRRASRRSQRAAAAKQSKNRGKKKR
jgi:hypothetical protein